MINEQNVIRDAAFTDTRADDFAAAFRNLRALYAGTPDQVTSIVRQFTNEVDAKHRKRFFKSLTIAYGVDVEAMLREEQLAETLSAAVQENVSLIKTIPENYFDKVEQAVYRNMAGGGSKKSLLLQIQEIGKVTENRARVIARDQNSKLNSRLNRERQVALGVEEYVWSTSRDDRVRKTHRDNNGKTFRWDKPPADTGHPGEDIMCRCIAQPVL